jgi:hypothetical protein
MGRFGGGDVNRRGTNRTLNGFFGAFMIGCIGRLVGVPVKQRSCGPRGLKPRTRQSSSLGHAVCGITLLAIGQSPKTAEAHGLKGSSLTFFLLDFCCDCRANGGEF